MDAVWSGAEGAVVGVVDGESNANPVGEAADDAFESVLAARNASAVRGDLETVLAEEPSLVLAAGEADLSAIARAGTDVPVLPVGDVDGIDAVDRDRLPAALEAVLAGEATVRRHVVLGVGVEAGGETADAELVARDRGLFDVALVTDEPARISEYGVSSRGDRVATFRADGVVVATPAGSHGYAGAVEAPHLSPDLDAVAVAPIAPFVTDTRRWVLPDDDLALTVERDEGAVAVVADGRRVTRVGVAERVALSADGALETLVVSAASLGDR